MVGKSRPVTLKLLLATLLSGVLSLSACANTLFLGTATSGFAQSGFIQAQGTRLTLGSGGAPIFLRGINVQNFWLVDPADPSNPFFQDDQDRGVPITTVVPERYDETVVRNIAAMGMNVIRNELNYRQFEDNANPFVYKESGFAELDRQIELAKQQGLYTIIDLHVPQGGLQGQVGPAARLWENPELRKRAKALWRALAMRYRDEPWVAAYELINEPTPSASPRQWASFAQELLDGIRQVDRNHLIIVDEITSVVDAFGNFPEVNPDEPFLPLVNDDNVLYDFHFYQPPEYVFQESDHGAGFDGGLVYPDEQFEFRDHNGNVVGRFNKDFLAEILLDRLEFRRVNNVPINIGEFSPTLFTFLNNNKLGGFDYLKDLLELFNQQGLNYQYFTYLKLYFEGFEYDENPELQRVTERFVQLFTQALK